MELRDLKDSLFRPLGPQGLLIKKIWLFSDINSQCQSARPLWHDVFFAEPRQGVAIFVAHGVVPRAQTMVVRRKKTAPRGRYNCFF